MRSIFLTGLLLSSSLVMAQAGETKRDLGAHEHGVGKLNIAFEAGQIALELEVPGADIVGFEHHAVSAEDRQKVDDAVGLLARPLKLFKVPEEAMCQVTAADVELHSGGSGDRQHELHDGDHAEEELHAETADEDHGDEDHGTESTHTEFYAQYILSCAQPDAVTHIDLSYFSVFPNAEELEIQMISNRGATAVEATRDNPRLELSGMI